MNHRCRGLMVLFLLLKLASQSLPSLHAADLQFGAVVTGTLADPGAEDSYSFNAVAGQRFFFDALDLNTANISARLVSPSGATLLSFQHYQDRGPFTVVEPGRYRLSLDGNGNTTGNYSFRLLEVAAAPVLEREVQINSQLNPRSQAALYRFQGTAGQRLVFKRIASSSNEANWYLYSPANEQLLGTGIGSDLGVAVLPIDGEYVLAVAGNASNATPMGYQFFVTDLSEPRVTPSGFGDVITGTVATGQTNRSTFAANAGQWIYFDSQQRNGGSVTMELRAPPGTNAPILTLNANSDAGPYILVSSGTYVVSVRGTGDYRFRWLNLNASPNLPLNSDYTGLLEVPYKTEVYRLGAQVGQRFYYDAIDADYDNVTVRVFDPTGRSIIGTSNSDADFGPLVTSLTGDYYLILESNLAAATDYRFRFLEYSALPALSFNTSITNVLASGKIGALYRFDGQAGQRLFFDGQATNSQLAMYLYGPNNQAISQANLQNNMEVTLAADGPHLFLIYGDTASSVTAFFRVMTPTSKTNALAIGVPVTGSIAEPGDVITYTFTGTPGRRLYYDAWSGDVLTRRLIAPSGQVVISQTSLTTDTGPVTLTEAGTYSLVIDGTDQNTGNFSFRLLDAAQAPSQQLQFHTEYGADLAAVPAGALNVTGTYINQSLRAVTNQTDWRITQTVAGARKDALLNFTTNGWGARAEVGITGGSDANWDNFSVQWDGTVTIAVNDTHLYTRSDDGSRLWIDLNNDGIFDASGSELVNNGWGTGHGVLTGPASIGLAPGTYKIRIQYEEGTSDNAFSLLWDAGISLSPGTRAEIYHFEGKAGQRLLFSPLPIDYGSGMASSANWYLYGPNNEQLSSRNIRGLFDITLNSSGTHVLVLDGYGTQPVPYHFRVLTPLTATAPLAIGAPIIGSITGGGDLHDYNFTGQAGQRLYLDTFNVNSPLRYVITSPSGTEIERAASQDYGPFTLKESGPYRLRIYGSGETTGDYSLRLIDLDSVQSRKLTLGSTYGLIPVPASALKITGSYVATSLRADTTQSDWRAAQRIAGTRSDPQINFAQTTWGQRAQVGLSGGTDDNWENYSVQWDGSLVVASSGSRLYTMSDDGSRFWIDLNNDGVFGSAAPELTDNHWGSGQGITLGSASVEIPPGSYRIRVQYEEGSGNNEMFFLTDQGDRLEPGSRANLYHFTGQAGQRVYLDSVRRISGGYWYIFGPNNESLPGSGTGTANDIEVTLPYTGEYTVLLDGYAQTPVPYSFRVLATTTATNAMALGATVSGTLADAGDQHVYTFTGTAGQRLYYDAVDLNTATLRARLESSSGTVVISTSHLHYQDYGPVTLPESGVYRLIIDGDTDATGSYSFRLLDVAAQPALSIGSNVSGQLQPRGLTQLYQFDGTAGRKLSFKRLASSANDATWELFSPQNQSLLSRGIASDLGDALLELNGSYVLAVEGSITGSDALNYQILVADISQNGPANPTGLGALQSGAITAGTTNRFTFTAPAGRWVYFDSQEPASGNLSIDLRDASGTLVSGTPFNAASDAGPFILPVSGNYTVAVRGNNQTVTGNYRFRLVDMAAVAPLALNQATTGILNPGYVTDIYQFNGTAGQRLYYDGLETDSDGTTVTLVSPNGRTTIINRNANNDSTPFTLAEPGVYYLFLRANQAASADYAFRLLDLAAQPLLTLGTLTTNTLIPGLSAQLYRFTGAAGQELYIDGLGTNRNGTMYLYNPQNQYLYSANIVDNITEDLTADGTYMVVITGSDESLNPVPYAFRAYINQSAPVPLTLGATVSGNLTQPGQENIYTFRGQAGQRLYFDALDGDDELVYVRLVAPSGTQIFSVRHRDDYGPFTLAESGDFQLIVFGNDDKIGNYRFRLLDAAAAPSVPLQFGSVYGSGLVAVPAARLALTGAYVNQSLNTYTNQDDWRVSQTVAGTRADTQIDFATDTWGTRAAVGVTGGTDARWQNFSVQWDGTITVVTNGTHLFLRSDDSSRFWIDLNNDNKFDTAGGEFVDNHWGRSQSSTLSAASVALAAGTYRIRVQYEARSSENTVQLLTDEALSIAPGNAAMLFQIAGQAGQRVFVDGSGPDNRGLLYLYGPKDNYIAGSNPTGYFDKTLDVSGTYLLLLSAYNNEEALPFTFRVNAFTPVPVPLTLGTVISNSFTEAGAEHRYTFEGVPGQQLYFDARSTNTSIYVRLTQPSGADLFNTFAGSDRGPFILRQGGTHTLVIYPSGDATGNYTFRLSDVASEPPLPLGNVLTSTLDPGRATLLYRLNGATGQRFYFDGQGSSGSASWYLYAPTTEYVGGTSINADFEVNGLTRGGTYTLVISGNSDAPVPYTVRVVSPASNAGQQNLPPTISAILSQTAPVNQPLGPLAFTVGDAETPAASLTVTAESSVPGLIPANRITLGGSGASRTISLNPLPNQTGTTVITITVTDAEGELASASFSVTVTGGNQPPTLSDIPDQVTDEGRSVGPITILVDDAETAATALMVEGRSSNQDLIRDSGVVIGGRGQSRSLLLFPNSGKTGQAVITIAVADLNGAVTTRQFQFTVNAVAPFIRAQPANQTVRAGQDAHFEVSAGGSAPLVYQWQFNGANVAGANQFALSLPNVNLPQAGNYAVIINNGSGAVTSQVARLRVLLPPVVATPPQTQVVAIGASVTFTVTVNGAGPFKYQWQLNGANIPGANSATFNIASAQPADSGRYTVVIASADGAVVSDPALLIVQTGLLGLADNFANRLRLNGSSGVGRGTNATFTREPGEPNHAGKLGSHSAWVSWVAPATGVAAFDTRGSSFDTLLAVYTGSSLASLTRVAADDDSGGFATSEVKFNVIGGTEYQIAIDGLKEAAGDIVLRWTSEATANLSPVIVTAPQSQVVALGAEARFSVVANNPVNGSLTYRWFRNGIVLPGETAATLIIPNAQVENAGRYAVEVANSVASVTTTPVALQLAGPNDSAIDLGATAEDKFADAITLSLAPFSGESSQARRTGFVNTPGGRTGAALARGYTGTQIFNSDGSTTDAGEPNHCGVIGGASQWFSYQAEADGTLTISTDGSDFDTVLAVYTGPGTDFESLVLAACDNDGGADGKDSLVRFNATAGTIYYIAVDGVDGATGNVRLGYKLDGPPKLSALSFGNGEFRLRLNGLPGANYTLEFSSGLPNWTPLITTNSPSGVLDIADPDAALFPVRFYRATAADPVTTPF